MKRLSIYMLFAMALVATGCSDKDEQSTPQLGSEVAKQTMDNLADDLAADIITVTQSEGIAAVGDLFALAELNDPFGGRKDANNGKKWLEKRANSLKSIMISKRVGFRTSENEGFNFQENVGVYTWNFDSQIFEKTSATGQVIIINFPSEGSETNDVQLRITAYEEELFEDEFGPYFMPTSLAADISVETVKQVEISFSASYSNDGDPVSGNVSLFLNPYTFTVVLDDTNATKVKFGFSVSKAAQTLIAADIDISFANSTKEDVNTISGFVSYSTIKLQGDINVAGIESEEVDYNEFVNLSLFDGISKIGDIVFQKETVDGFEENVPYLKYSDGSKEKLEEVLSPFIDEMENLQIELESWGE